VWKKKVISIKGHLNHQNRQNHLKVISIKIYKSFPRALRNESSSGAQAGTL
jgi:hypothetical protein